MTVYQALLGTLTIGADTNTIDLDDNAAATPTVTLTSGTYFISTLCDHIQAQIRAEGGNFAAVTCAYSLSTGKVYIGEATAKDIDITWTDTDLRDLLGFTGDITVGTGGGGDAQEIGPNEARYQWRPDRAITTHPTARDVVWEPESNTSVYRSRDGTTASVAGALLYRAQLDWRWIAGARAYTPSTGSVNQDFQQFFTDVVHLGLPIRYYPDTTSAIYETGIVGDGESNVGAFSDYARRERANNLSWWRVSLPMLKHVS
jgi:hypothetical protein